jgi:hypothetical protein
LEIRTELETHRPSFDHTVLSEFRTRVVNNNREQPLLDKMLETFNAKGLKVTKLEFADMYALRLVQYATLEHSIRPEQTPKIGFETSIAIRFQMLGRKKTRNLYTLG